MATNKFFSDLHNGNDDQSLVEDLIIECIQIYGMDCYYVPYTLINEDKLYGEDTLMEFNKAYDLEMYIETISSLEGRGDFLAKFGLQIDDAGNLMCSIRRFRQACNYEYYRPREKDLIYFPLVKSLFEITYVEHEKLFHQLGALQVYSMRIQLLNYNNQKIRTGVREIDAVENEHCFTVSYQLEQTGTSRFIMGEMVYQGASLATSTAKGMVVSYDRIGKILVVKDQVGTFDVAHGPIIGETSHASFGIHAFDNQELPNEPIADNKEITSEGTVFVNWSEKNPFSDQ